MRLEVLNTITHIYSFPTRYVNMNNIEDMQADPCKSINWKQSNDNS